MTPSRQLLADAWSRTLAADPSAVPPVAVDTETFYRTESRAKKTGLPAVSVEVQGNWAYCRHPEWECYLVTLYSPANPTLGLPEIDYAGPPETAPWGDVAGRAWWHHNAGFDRHQLDRLREKGVMPDVQPSATHDTADLAVYHHLPRGLAKALLHRYHITMDKSARAEMDGRRWGELSHEEQARMREYASEDAVGCCLLAVDLAPTWPAEEVALSDHTAEIEFRGIPVDVEKVGTCIGVLTTALWAAEKRIPWLGAIDEDTGRPFALRSPKALRLECQKAGVPAPVTTDQKSQDFLAWLDDYGAAVPAVLDLARYRRIDRALASFRQLAARIRPDGRAALSLKYMGAEKTGRWSGAGKFNLQNQMKTPLFFDSDFGWLTDGAGAAHTVDMRSCIRASSGQKLYTADLSQIEPRVLNWRVDNEDFLRLCAGVGPYEAHARTSMGWTGGKLKDEAPQLYDLAKARVIALGYGAGWQQFLAMARGYMRTEEAFLAVFAAENKAGDEEDFLDTLSWLAKRNTRSRGAQDTMAQWETLDSRSRRTWVNAFAIVRDFRRTNPGVTRLWSQLDDDFRRAAYGSTLGDGVLRTKLPSGRELVYFECSGNLGGSSRPGNHAAKPQKTYGGLLTENLVQAIARDIFGHGILNLERAGYRVLFHVHDEVVVEAAEGTDPEEIKRLLCDAPSWARGLPVAAGCKVCDVYQK